MEKHSPRTQPLLKEHMKSTTKTCFHLPDLFKIPLSRFHFHCCCLGSGSLPAPFPWLIVLLANSPLPLLASNPTLSLPLSPPYTENQKSIFFSFFSFNAGHSSIKSFIGFPFSTGKYSHSKAHWIVLQTFYNLASPYLSSFTHSPLSCPI